MFVHVFVLLITSLSMWIKDKKNVFYKIFRCSAVALTAKNRRYVGGKYGIIYDSLRKQTSLLARSGGREGGSEYSLGCISIHWVALLVGQILSKYSFIA